MTLARRRVSDAIEIRELTGTDSIADLTDLLHRAYKRLLDMGLRYTATAQSENTTRERIKGGRCLVAVLDGRLVGTVTFHFPSSWHGSPWLTRGDVATLGQLAVEPAWQRHGIGTLLINRAEAIAIDCGAAEVALSTAESATHLVDFYSHRGYRCIEYTDATISQGYRSVILSKTLR